MRILTEYLLMGPLDGVGGGPPPPGSTPPPEDGPPTGEGDKPTGDAGGKPGTGDAPPPGGAVDGELSEAEAMEIFSEEMGEASDVGNLALDNPDAAVCLARIHEAATLRGMEKGTADRGVADTADHHEAETGELHAEADTFTREMGGRTSFREVIRAAMQSGDRGAIERAFQERFGSGALAQPKTNTSGGEAGTDTRTRDPATPKPGTTPNPAAGKSAATATPTRPVINMATLTPQQRTMVERFMALRNEARQLRQQADGMRESDPARAAELMAQAEAKSEEGNGIQAMLAADGIPMSEDADVREEGEAGDESSGDGGTTGEGGGVSGLGADEVVTRTPGREGEGGGSDRDGADTRRDEPRLSTADVSARSYVRFGAGDDRSVRASGDRVVLKSIIGGGYTYAHGDAVRFFRDGGGDGEGGGGDRRRRDDSNPLDGAPITRMPGWERSVDHAGGRAGSVIIRGPKREIYAGWELSAARDIREGRRDASETTLRMASFMKMPMEQLNELIGDRPRSGSESTLGPGPSLTTLMARCRSRSWSLMDQERGVYCADGRM